MRGKVFRSGAAAVAAQTRDRREFIHDVLIPAEWESAQRTLRKVSKDSPVDRGEYKHGWSVRRALGNHPHLANDAPHAGIIELGARPHWAPFAPLYEWAQRKAADIGIAPPDVYGFAKAVQAKIAAEGQAPKFIMRNRLDDATRYLRLAIERRAATWQGHSGTA